jgi:uncharacterized protein YigE (DUF2233 family)
MSRLTPFFPAVLLVLAMCAPCRATPSAVRTPCADLVVDGASFTVCSFDSRRDSIRLFLRDAGGAVYGSFSGLSDAVAGQGGRLIFAMNAGMYDDAFAPVGLYVENGRLLHEANTQAGAGNFHLKPNGVFWIDGARAGVTETGRFLRSRNHPAFATQSGPMLLLNGRVNPHIHASGASLKYRNGVGVAEGHIVRFAISNAPVTFHQFAALFRDHLKCPDALFLDGGTASALYAPSLDRHDRFHPMGPMIGVVEKAR